MSDIVESDIVERLIDGDDLTSRIEAAALIKRLRAALVSIRDIEKPMFGEQPERYWLAWYSTAMQMAELAYDALITAKPERNE